MSLLPDYDYSLRGKCKEYSEKYIKDHPNENLRLVRGYYHCPIWGQQNHWWVEDSNGNIIDPTKNQFPSCGIGEYEEFDPETTPLYCENCGKEGRYEDVEHGSWIVMGNYVVCSNYCACKLVGV